MGSSRGLNGQASLQSKVWNERIATYLYNCQREVDSTLHIHPTEFIFLIVLLGFCQGTGQDCSNAICMQREPGRRLNSPVS